MCVARRESVCSARCSHDGVAALVCIVLYFWLGTKENFLADHSFVNQ